MAINEHVIEEILRDCECLDDLLGDNGLLAELQRRVLAKARKSFPVISGSIFDSEKELKTATDLSTVRDEIRESILSLYARGRDTGSIQRHVSEHHNVTLCLTDIQQVIDQLWIEYQAWQTRPLGNTYPVIYLDTYSVLVRLKARVERYQVQSAIGLDAYGRRDVLGFWLHNADDEPNWNVLLAELQTRGLDDCAILCVDEMDAVHQESLAIWPKRILLRCPARMLRNTLRYVDWRDRKHVHYEIKALLAAHDREEAAQIIAAFCSRWGARYPSVSEYWRSQPEAFFAFYDFSPAIRNVLQGVGVVELLHTSFAKFEESGQPFAHQRELLQRFYVGYLNIAKKWSAPLLDWQNSAFELSQRFPGRIPLI